MVSKSLLVLPISKTMRDKYQVNFLHAPIILVDQPLNIQTYNSLQFWYVVEPRKIPRPPRLKVNILIVSFIGGNA